MRKKKLLAKIINRETILYLIFGVLTTLVALAVYLLSARLFAALGWRGFAGLFLSGKDYSYLDANTISWIVAVLFAFVTNKLLVFESKSRERRVVLRELASFTAARLVSFGVEQGLMFLLVSVLAIDVWAAGLLRGTWSAAADFVEGYALFAKCFVMFAVVVLNYFFSKLFIFKKDEKPDGTEG
ncbi:MAG: GtrA family protein [Clostridium sp.]|nr:GtrA family protein [Clostridium sp.]